MSVKRPTQIDVARLAGVSRSTVSLVLNDRTAGNVAISEETRQRVRQMAEQVGYSPNPIAQMLVQGSNRIIGVFTYEPDFPFEHEDHHHPYLLGIEREASRQGYDVMLFTRGRSAGKPRIYDGAANTLLLADGAILLGTYPDREELRRLAEEGYPFVYIGRREVPDLELDWVVSDYVSGSYQATKYLLDSGHRHLAFVDHRPDTEASNDKLAGCQQMLAETRDASLTIVEYPILTKQAELLKVLLDRRITALLARDLFVMRDLVVLLEAAELHVPEDFSVLALGGGSPNLLPNAQPTRVRINREQVGIQALRVLARRIAGETEKAQHICVPCEFVIGDTTTTPHK